MTDQQNYEATRPVSADPAVALAEALGQLPDAPLSKPPAIELKPTTPEDFSRSVGR